jgi:hypothetical protein
MAHPLPATIAVTDLEKVVEDMKRTGAERFWAVAEPAGSERLRFFVDCQVSMILRSDKGHEYALVGSLEGNPSRVVVRREESL